MRAGDAMRAAFAERGVESEVYVSGINRQGARLLDGDAEPRLMTLVIIADALGVKLDDLVAGLPVPKERRPPPNRRGNCRNRPA